MNEDQSYRRINLEKGNTRAVLTSVLKLAAVTYTATLNDKQSVLFVFDNMIYTIPLSNDESASSKRLLKSYLIDIQAMLKFINDRRHHYIYLVNPLAVVLFNALDSYTECLYDDLSLNQFRTIRSILVKIDNTLEAI